MGPMGPMGPMGVGWDFDRGKSSGSALKIKPYP